MTAEPSTDTAVGPKYALPNAPKKQPCPLCHRQVKRTYKGPGMAKYHCKKCDITIVESLRQEVGEQ